MAETFGNRLKSAWNAFMNRDPPNYKDLGMSYSYRPDRFRVMSGNEKTIITAIYNKMAMDCSAIEIIHAKLDENDRYVSPMSSGLNTCLTLSANKDQTARAFRQDVVMSMFDEGCVAVVPIDTITDRRDPDVYDIYSMRVGKIIQWYPDYVRVRVYNDWRGCTEDITLPKAKVAIIENPLYAVMNEPNSVVQRLKRKLGLLDAADEQSTSGRLDMIIQLPYVIKTEARRAEANKRRQEIEEQLNNSKYGIAYADGTERIIQLNRPVENNLMSQIEYLTNMVYSQLGITQEIMNGTADEKTMQNYYSRSIEPIISAIVEEMRRKFLTEAARSEHVSIVFFRDPFKLIPVSAIADIADKFTRNEILSSNEIRQVIGRKPVDDPKADELRNKNLNAGEGQDFANTSQNKEEFPPSEKSAG